MRASDVTDTLNLALEASGCDKAEVIHKPRLLSDNGSSYIAGDRRLAGRGSGHMGHVRHATIPEGSEQGSWPRWGRAPAQ